MMKNKPSWGFWIAWVVAYSALDLVLAAVMHGSFAMSQVPGAVEGALFGATVTWFFALWRWHKADAGL